MSDPGGFASESVRVCPHDGAVEECDVGAPAPSAPNPNAAVLMKARLEFGLFVGAM